MNYLKKKKSKIKFRFLIIFITKHKVLPVSLFLLFVLFFWKNKLVNLIFNFSRKNFSKQELITPLSPLSITKKLKNDLDFLGIEIIGEPKELNDGVVTVLSSGTTIIFKKGGDYSYELDSLQLILKNIRIEGKWPLKIDLRFTRPIITF